MAIELTTATLSQLSGIRLAFLTPIFESVYPNSVVTFSVDGGFSFVAGGSVLNCDPLYRCKRVRLAPADSIINVSSLLEVEDSGTNPAINLAATGWTQSQLNAFFTDLPTTTKTATINVVGNPGAATCNTTIATNKGYMVVTS